MRSSRLAARLATAALVVASLGSLTADAWADRVARLGTRGSASTDGKLALDKATAAALTALGHTSPTAAETAEGEAAAGALEDRSAGLVSIGKVTSSDWVIEPTLSGVVGGQRVEVKACQVSSGRVETLARDLDPAVDASSQVRELLGLLLRAQGVGDDPLPWEKRAALPPPPKTNTPPAPTPTAKPLPAAPADPPPSWDSGGDYRLGLELGASAIAVRPDHTVGDRAVGTWALVGLIRLPIGDPKTPHWELAGSIGGWYGAFGGVRLGLGMRYAIFASERFVVAPELALGALAQVGGNGDARLLFAGGAHFSFILLRSLELEVHPSIDLSPGGSGAVVIAGGTVGALFRL
jgi:hypothetical protein